jgi:leucyl aminopeptidase
LPSRAHARRPRRRRPALRARAAAIAETFIDEGGTARRVLLVGLGGRRDDEAIYERVGGALTARLLSSGETRLVIDLSGLNFDGLAAARIGFGAAARSWRHDVYRTRLGRKQKPTLEEVIIVGGGAMRRSAGFTRPRSSTASTSPARSSPSRPTSSIPKASSPAAARRWRASASNSRCWTRPRWRSWA